MNVKVKYFAMFREQAGRNQEELEFSGKTVKELFEQLSLKYQFTLDMDDLKVAINESYRPMSTEIQAGDVVVFIPPVAGG